MVSWIIQKGLNRIPTAFICRNIRKNKSGGKPPTKCNSCFWHMNRTIFTAGVRKAMWQTVQVNYKTDVSQVCSLWFAWKAHSTDWSGQSWIFKTLLFSKSFISFRIRATLYRSSWNFATGTWSRKIFRLWWAVFCVRFHGAVIIKMGPLLLITVNFCLEPSKPANLDHIFEQLNSCPFRGTISARTSLWRASELQMDALPAERAARVINGLFSLLLFATKVPTREPSAYFWLSLWHHFLFNGITPGLQQLPGKLFSPLNEPGWTAQLAPVVYEANAEWSGLGSPNALQSWFNFLQIINRQHLKQADETYFKAVSRPVRESQLHQDGRLQGTCQRAENNDCIIAVRK